MRFCDGRKMCFMVFAVLAENMFHGFGRKICFMILAGKCVFIILVGKYGFAILAQNTFL